MSSLSILPQSRGLLPYWHLFLVSLSIYHVTMNFLDAKLRVNHTLYSRAGPSINPLQSRVAGIWTLLSATVRFHAAYDIHNGSLYRLTMFTYLYVLVHFLSEVFYYKTSRVLPDTISSLIFSTTSLVWMWNQYSFYVRY